MSKLLYLLSALTMSAALAACGNVQSTLVSGPSNLSTNKQITLPPVQVTSVEQDADSLALNEKWKQLAAAEIQSMMSSKGFAVTPAGETAVSCQIDITYGSRALRYFVGFGAGAGHIQIHLALTDRTGATHYETKTEADLAIGGFGGDMSAVVQDAIHGAVKDFADRV